MKHTKLIVILTSLHSAYIISQKVYTVIIFSHCINFEICSGEQNQSNLWNNLLRKQFLYILFNHKIISPIVQKV